MMIPKIDRFVDIPPLCGGNSTVECIEFLKFILEMVKIAHHHGSVGTCPLNDLNIVRCVYIELFDLSVPKAMVANKAAKVE